MSEIRKISDHSRTREGQVDATGRHLGNTTKGHAQYVIISDSGSKRTSKTVHCSESEAKQIANSL